ncbi:uncharacterized protein LOC129362538 isoform X2 [Poeciliopsis prolifica]|uniref:uncharacterized protein LOC129362538 isoform X2 n=1 Tax=Poeciliopsis prolifica TaxID=188132 RepID=UPI0024130A32|nr:uncharacterized protein LOC129362538 isoform X2 [Poeciliopsis prolifica]
MSDSLMRGVRVQLTTTMDSVLRTAVFEVMRIFESALYNHKMEMAQKGEEIAQLKTKLQATELKLKDFAMNSPRRAEMTETRSKPEVVPVGPEQPVTAPEIDVEVPDDWCAPLGCDASNRQEEGCPSEFNHVIDPQKSPVGRRSKRISVINEKLNPRQDESKPTRHPKLSGDLNKLLQGLSKDYCNLTALGRLRKRQINEETFTDDDKKEKKDEKDSSKHNEKNQRKYVCETCYRVFNTKKGLGVHVSSQRKCKGCLRALCFQSDVESHKRVCAEYKKLMKEKRRLKEKKNPLKRKTLNSSKTEVIEKKKIAQSSVDKKNNATRKFSCKQCSYRTNSRNKFRRHKMSHSEKTQTSPTRLKRLDEKKEFDVYESKNKSLMQVSNQNGDLGWTEPLEDVDEDEVLKRGEKMQK